MVRRRWPTVPAVLLLAAATLIVGPAGSATGRPAEQAENPNPKPEYGTAVDFAVSKPAGEIARDAAAVGKAAIGQRPEERGPDVQDDGFHGDTPAARPAPDLDVPAPPPTLTFQGITNSCGGCSPPDTVGDVGPQHYVQMVNVHFAAWTKAGVAVVPTTPIAALFAPIANCNIGWGDPVVLHDQLADRWILTQFTAAAPFLLCIAVSQTPNPAGAYNLYAFPTGGFFPDYPKFGVWPNGLYGSTREFNGAAFVGVGAYAFDKAAMYAAAPAPAFVKFLLAPGVMPFRPGDGLLPTDLDGRNLPPGVNPPNPFVGTMDSGGPYAAPIDGLNLFHLRVTSFAPPTATFTFIKQIAVVAFDSIFPCAPGPRDCIPQPGTAQKVDILSYRQRPMHRLAYRNFLSYESLVTNQSVEALAGIAGVRWYEMRSPLTAAASVFQQGTVVANDGIHRWMGSIAQDKNGNMALGYSASGAMMLPNHFPSIRYVGRLAGDALNTMPWTERVLFPGAGSQTGGPRWGDYTSMNSDPADNCTFWYTNQYYTVSSPTTWTTRIGRFRFPNC